MKRANAYAYVVTRIVKYPKEGIVEIPNLGVHRTLTRGLQHYKSVFQDRAPRIVNLIENDVRVYKDHPCLVLAEFFTSDNENVRLERWTL